MARVRYLDGLEKVRRVFNKAPKENVERITHALNLGGKEIADAANEAVPVDEGDLKGTIKARSPKVINFDRRVIVSIVAGDSKETANAAYRQEFGRKKGPKGHPGHDPQEFMFPGYWSKRKRVRSRIKREIKRAVRALRQA